MPPLYTYVVRDDSSDKPQEENKSTDANNGTPTPEHPTGSNAGLIAGSITSVAVVIFLLIVVLVPYIKKRRQQNEANKPISGPTRPVTQYLGSDLAYNRGQRRLSLVDKLATQPPRQSGELSRNNSTNSRISVLSAMVPRSPRDPFADPVRRSSFTYKKGSPTLPMQTVPENVDASGGYYDEKEVAKSASPLSAYIQHHLQTYSANGAQSNFPVSAPAYQTGFNVPGRTGPAADDFSPHSPETAYTASVYAPSEASDYDDHHHIPPPSAPPLYMYSQEAAQDRARASTPRSPRVSDLLRRRDRSSQYSNGTGSDRSSVAESDRSSRKAGRRPPPLPLSPDEPEFTINPVEYHHHDEHHDEVWTAAHMPLPQSAIPRSARTAGGQSAKTPSRVPIPVTPMHDDDHVVISPTPGHGTNKFTDIPYPRSR
jgi:hypothetical protein